ncbi:MAG: hypothetical protein ABR587_02015 [Candidatus Binatia bacterium]
MKRTSTFLLLLGACVAAGLWLLRPTPLDAPPQEEVTGSCEASACGTVVAGSEVPTTGEASPAAVAPRPSRDLPAPTPAPAPAAAPANGEDLREQADQLLAEGRVLEGIEAMRKATEADPSARNHGDLGALLNRLTAFDEAARHLERAAELDPANADRWIALANVHYRAVNPGEAWKAERRARAAEPGLVLSRDAEGMRIRQGDTAPGKK